MLILRVGSEQSGYVEDVAVALHQRGIESRRATSGSEALEYMRLQEFDLVMTDLLLPDMIGDEVVRLARAKGINTPVIIIAVGATSGMRAKALDMGADDFVTLPCDFDELAARIRAIVRRRQGHAKSVLKVGSVELSLDQREVHVRGRKLPLTRREFSVLELMFLKQGTILDKAALVNHLYHGVDEPDIKSIDVVMCRLRKKLASAGVESLVSTIWGCGYTLQEPTITPDRVAAEAQLQLVA